jgi:hypothetical protein
MAREDGPNYWIYKDNLRNPAQSQWQRTTLLGRPKSLKGAVREVAIAGRLPNNSVPLQAAHPADAQVRTFRPDGVHSFGFGKTLRMCYKKGALRQNIYGEPPMHKTVKFVSLTAAALLTAGMLGGCATTAQVEEAKALAQQALDKANAAQACCDANTDRVNRMYQKIMSK